MFGACPDCGENHLSGHLSQLALPFTVLGSVIVVLLGISSLLATPLIAFFQGLPWALAAVAGGPLLMAIGFRLSGHGHGRSCRRCGWSPRRG